MCFCKKKCIYPYLKRYKQFCVTSAICRTCVHERLCLRRMSLAKTNVRLQEQRKQSFLTLPKENQSPFGLYRNPPTFFFTNPRFVLLICDRRIFIFIFWKNYSKLFISYDLFLNYYYYYFAFCFVLSPHSSLIMQRRRPTSSAGRFRWWQLDEVREMFITFEIWIFFLQNAWIRNRRPLFNTFFYGFTHFILRVLDCETETLADCNYRA